MDVVPLVMEMVEVMVISLVTTQVFPPAVAQLERAEKVETEDVARSRGVIWAVNGESPCCCGASDSDRGPSIFDPVSGIHDVDAFRDCSPALASPAPVATVPVEAMASRTWCWTSNKSKPKTLRSRRVVTDGKVHAMERLCCGCMAGT